jgi:hypothetical protein
LRVTIRRSKTDQEGHGHVIAIARGVIACPVAALPATNVRRCLSICCTS